VFLFDLFRSLLPLHNPIGFGAADFIEFAIAAILIIIILLWRHISTIAHLLAQKPRWCMTAVAVMPIAMRLALLPHYPVPTPSGSDDFSYLLLADTISHHRLANPVHPMHQFFESIFVLQEPSYSSIFPLGQGFVLTLGWAGVLLAAGLFCGLCFWMLRGWTTPRWAFFGALLAVAQFGPLCKWMNDYWGGSLSACAGCLVFGALPRLRERHQVRDGALLGLGIAVQWLTRPFECVLLVLAAAVYLAPGDARKLRRPALVAMIPLLLSLGLTLLQNHQVTKDWSTMPYMLSRYQYGVPAAFTIQPNPIPHRALTPEQQLDYDAQSAVHGPGTDSFSAYWQRLASRVGFYRFFFLVPLFITPLAFLARIRHWRYGWVLVAVSIFALGTNFYPYFYPHYIAAAACLFLLISATGLETLAALGTTGRDLARLIVLLCAAHTILWYTLHLVGTENQRVALMRYENWDFINYGDPEGRIAINQQLEKQAGRQLVFVRYWPQHRFHEWIHNAAEIDNSPVVWAADLGEEKNRTLQRYYQTRTAWLLEPDARPPRLSTYR
jgi:hypothetical protein